MAEPESTPDAAAQPVASETPPPASPDAEPAGEAKPEPPNGNADAENAAIRTDNYRISISGLQADNVFFGANNPHRSRGAVAVSEDHIKRVRRFFHTPPAFNEALSLLVSDNLVILCGAAGTGRRHADLRMLDGPNCPGLNRGQPIVLLAPDIQLTSLYRHPFRRGGRYLFEDLTPDVDRDYLEFDTTRLKNQLQAADAFLVVTSPAGSSEFESCAVEWISVNIIDAFEAFTLTTDWSSDDIARIRNIITSQRLRRFSDIIEMVHHQGFDAAERQYAVDLIKNLRTSLDGDRPRVADLAELATAALIPNATEHEHERRAAELRVAFDKHAKRSRSDADYTDALSPSRSTRGEVICRKPDLASGVITIELAGNLQSDSILAELHERYGDELWPPIRTWLDTQPDQELRIAQSLAKGLKGLRMVDVHLSEQVLERWAAGDDHHRWAAALANSELCTDNQGVQIALTQATRWARGTQGQKITSIYTFSLNLDAWGPRRAIRQLWILSLSDAVVARFACTHLAALARDTADVGTRRHVLAEVERQLTHLLGTLPDDDERVGRALSNVQRLLTVRTTEGTPMTAHELCRNPGQAARFGLLWTHVLRSWRFRVTALDELHAAYAVLSDTSKAALGAAIHARMSTMEWQWLCRDLGIKLQTNADKNTMLSAAAP